MPVVLVVCYGITTIKVCNYTAFEAWSGGGMDYFCTDATLHRRRWWIGSRGRVQLVRLDGGGRDADGCQAVRLAGGLAGLYPPPAWIWLGRYVGLVSRNFFLSFGSPRSAVLADGDCVSCCVCVDTKEVDK